MKKQELQGYAVLELTHSGIPEQEIHPEAFNEHQKAVLAALPGIHQEAINKGYPIVVVNSATRERIEAFNLMNVALDKYQEERFARGLLEAVRRFYKDPENRKKAEEWKKKQAQEKSKNE